MNREKSSIKPKLMWDPSVDMIRCCAFTMVVMVHFFLNSGIYNLPVASKTAFAMCTLRSFSVASVPLFMMLTGFLQKEKRPEVSYFVRIIPVLTVYGLCSLANIAFTDIYASVHDTPAQVVMKILNFKGAKYAWYVEMYITLFLTAPYINLAWKGLKNRRARSVLIGIACFTAIAPALLNIWDIGSLEWWRRPSSGSEYNKLVPDWFKRLYPFAYYLIGCYLAEYKIRLKRTKCVCGIIIMTIAAGAFNYWRSWPGKFISGDWSNYASPFTAAIAVLVFIYFLSGNYENMSTRTRSFWKAWASVTFGAYLLSRIPDIVVYNRLAQFVPNPGSRLVWMFVTVPVIAVISCIMSRIVNIVAVPLAGKLTALVSDFMKQCKDSTKA